MDFFELLNSGALAGRWPGILGAGGVLVLFSYVYNKLVAYLHRHGLNDGFVWLEVVVGVGATLIAGGFAIGWMNVLVLGFLFGCSGLWMVIGDIQRYVTARRGEVGDEAEELAEKRATRPKSYRRRG